MKPYFSQIDTNMKILDPKTHGIIDYLVVIFLWASPTLFGLPPTTALFTYVLGGIHLLLTVSTRFPLGFLNLIPFQLHGTIELIVSLVLVGVAFYLGGEEGALARNFYLGFAAAVFLTWLVTDYGGKTVPTVA